MKDLYPKFIIEDGRIILGKVTYHKELIIDETLVNGGGWYIIKNDIITFYGDSHDLGEASLENIKNAVNNNNVYTNPLKMCNISKKYNFQYKTLDNEIIKL